MTDTTTRDPDPGPWCRACQSHRAESEGALCPSCGDRPVRMDPFGTKVPLQLTRTENDLCETPSDRLPRSATTPTASNVASTGSESVEAESPTRLTPRWIARRWMNL